MERTQKRQCHYCQESKLLTFIEEHEANCRQLFEEDRIVNGDEVVDDDFSR